MDPTAAYKAGESAGVWNATAICSLLMLVGMYDSLEGWQIAGLIGLTLLSFYKYRQCWDRFCEKRNSQP